MSVGKLPGKDATDEQLNSNNSERQLLSNNIEPKVSLERRSNCPEPVMIVETRHKC